MNKPRRKKKSPKAAPPKTKEVETLTGVIRVHPRGFGFVTPNNASLHSQDIFIPKHLIDNAVDGDQVEIVINPDSNWEKGPDGKIVSIKERNRSSLVGIITHTEAAIFAYVPILGMSKPVVVRPLEKQALAVGARVILKVLDWGDHKKPIICEVKQIIGDIEDPACDVRAASQEYELHVEFPQKTLEEAKSFGNKVSKKDLASRLDLSEANCITIDPETAKDFDDALSILKDTRGHFFLGVHIADVAHYVQVGSQLDLESFRRCNSTYFPGVCIPMLPEELSNNLCSLRQDVLRLTVSVLMEFDPKGTLVHSEIKRSYIKSKRRFTYGEAKQILDEKKKSPYFQELKCMQELCFLLKQKRAERGSIDFALPDLVIQIDPDGNPTGVKIEEYDITHQLVEEFMLKANEIVAKTLDERGKALIFRIHEQPTSENMEDFFSTARSLGFKLPSQPTQEDLQNLFYQASTTPFSQQLAVGFIRNLKLAYYSPHNVGHFGLALEHYCHFTSPIRRYSDLITQRLLFNEEGEELNLEKISQSCSEKERISFRAEMSVKLLKKLRLLKNWFVEDPAKSYEAYITKIKPFGLFFEVKQLFLEGFLHISELENDFFVYEPTIPLLQGRATGKRHMVGNSIQVQPVHIDLIHLETKWVLLQTRKRKHFS